jgi:hypothetical protein
MDGRSPSWLRLAAPQVFLFIAIFAVQAFSVLVSALGCGDDGPVDYGDATELQRRYCEEIPDSDAMLAFYSPLLVFVVVNVLTRFRSRWKPVLAALPFLVLTGFLPIALWVNWP